MIGSPKTKLAASAGMMLILATVLLFMRVFPERESQYMTALCFVVMGIALPIAGFIWVEDSQGRLIGSGLKAGVYSLFFIYGVSAVSLAMLLLMLGGDTGLLATLEVVLLLGFGAVLVYVSRVIAERGQSRERMLATVEFMRGLEDEVYIMAGEPANAVYREQLRRVGEALKYSDYSGATSLDGALGEKVRELRYALADIASGGESAALQEAEVKGRQISLIADDIVKITGDRNHELLNEKRARSIDHGA